MKSFLFIFLAGATSAFSPSSSSLLQSNVFSNYSRKVGRVQIHLHQSSEEKNEKNSIDVMMGKVDIPEEYREEIFRVEGNTPAAKDRQTRVAIFSAVALLGIAISSFNAFLANMRDGADLSGINELGFGWVSGNPLTSFLFLNKFGGGLALLSAGLGGTFVELEVRKNSSFQII